jgi:hypothetical protein
MTLTRRAKHWHDVIVEAIGSKPGRRLKARHVFRMMLRVLMANRIEIPCREAKLLQLRELAQAEYG